MALVSVSAVVAAAGVVVAPQAFAGTLPGMGRSAARESGGLAAGGREGAGFAGLGDLLGRGRGGTSDAGQQGGAGIGGGQRGGAGNGGGQRGGAGNGGGQQDGSCADVEVVFARGTGERPGLGIVGQPLVRALAANLPGLNVDSFAVDYAAAFSQASAGPGATNMSQHITAVAQDCPETQFVIGGYSQGATVTDIAIGIQGVGTRGEAIPEELAPRVAAVVAFGNPLGLRRQTIAGSSETYGPKSIEFCAGGDPVCGGGANFAAHISYPANGSVDEAADFAADQINGS